MNIILRKSSKCSPTILKSIRKNVKQPTNRDLHSSVFAHFKGVGIRLIANDFDAVGMDDPVDDIRWIILASEFGITGVVHQVDYPHPRPNGAGPTK